MKWLFVSIEFNAFRITPAAHLESIDLESLDTNSQFVSMELASESRDLMESNCIGDGVELHRRRSRNAQETKSKVIDTKCGFVSMESN